MAGKSALVEKAAEPRSASVACMQKKPDGRQRDNIARLVLYGMAVNGRTIDELGTKHRGRRAQLAWRSKPVWHRKADLDLWLGKEMGLPSTMWGPRRRSNELADTTSAVLSKLRKSGRLADWSDRRTNLYRLSDPSRRAGKPPADPRDYWPEPETMERTERNMRKAFTSIISEGRRDNTYKFALGKTLLDYCKKYAADGSARQIKYEHLAKEFLKHYWYQKYKFRMKQDFHTKSQPRIMTVLGKIFVGAQPASFDRANKKLEKEATRMILSDVFGHDREKKGMVVPRFQNVRHGGTTASINVFYDYDDDRRAITLHPEAHAFFSGNHALLTRALLAEWVLYLERVNHGLPRLAAKIEAGDRKPGSLKKYKDMLYEHAKKCFYCGGRLGAVHVDHFIPRSYIFDDSVWNLVLACPRCNLAKSNSLPCDDPYLRDLIARNQRYAGRDWMKKSLRQLADGSKTWEEEIRHHYDICEEYGFGRWGFVGPRRGRAAARPSRSARGGV